MVLDGSGRVWEGLEGVGRGGKGWEEVGRGSCYGGGYFLYIFSGFAIDRSKKYIKTIKIYMKIDAVDPQAAADNPPQPPVTMVRCLAPYNPQNPVK